MNVAHREPLIELVDVHKVYGGSDSTPIEVLKGISLTIRAGEFVAIMGQSGSGKSTLMNILGLLDRPTGGEYRLDGRDVAHLGHDELAQLRREVFGFVFQQYNLIPTITAAENVAVPAAYAGVGLRDRLRKANALLERLGLADRTGHRPNQLSGGQQQRVSIARALINGGRVVLADEPTGALDSQSGEQVIALLRELAAEGHTVILITHDPGVASVAHRIIAIKDGAVVSDTQTGTQPRYETEACAAGAPLTRAPEPTSVLLSDMREAVRSGGRALLAASFRTALTLTGIIVGVASIIALLAIGEGAKEAVLAQIAVFGANRLYVSPGGESSRGPGGRLLESDVELLRDLPNVAMAMPYLYGNVTVRAGNVDHSTTAVAVTTDFPVILHWPMQSGVFFTKDDELAMATVAVIGSKLAGRMFPDGTDPIRQWILVDNVPFQVIGVLTSKGALSGDADDDDTVTMPFSTGSLRVLGKRELSWISVLIDDLARAKETEAAITAKLEAAHNTRDFRIYNLAATVETANETQNTFKFLLGCTAAISLFVGGIGVMNVMLMTVTERTREIGIRIATGARTRDIVRQFLTEAVMVAGAGGIVGGLAGVATGFVAAYAFGMPVIFSATVIIASVACAVATGLVFGLLPALRAARLEPVAALARE